MKTKKILGFDQGIGIYEVTDKGRAPHIMNRSEGEKVFRSSLINQQLKWLQKEILTVLEATIDDSRKLEATKTLVKDKISSKMSWIYEICGMPDEDAEVMNLK